MFEQSPFHFPEFCSVKGPAFPFERLSELDQSIFQVLPEPFHDMEVIALKGSFGPDFTDDFGEGGPEVEDNAVRLNIPVIEVSEKPFGYATAIKPGTRFNIQDSSLDGICGNLFISASSPGHIFIEPRGLRRIGVGLGFREVIFGSQALFPSIYVDLDPVVLKLRDSVWAIRPKVLLS